MMRDSMFSGKLRMQISGRQGVMMLRERVACIHSKPSSPQCFEEEVLRPGAPKSNHDFTKIGCTDLHADEYKIHCIPL